MRPLAVAVAAATLLLSGSGVAAAQLSITVTGSPAQMSIVGAVPGSEPTAATDASTSYTVTTKLPPRTSARIIGQLDADMPPGTTLSITLSGVAGGTSSGAVLLDATPRDLVTNIGNTGKKGATGSITYQFTATSATGVVAPSARTVTLTIVSP